MTHILLTAGPTYEPLDPVRFLGNRSTGKMGYALAEAFAAVGATVTLVSGPTWLPDPPHPAIRTVRVETAAQMFAAAAEVAPAARVWVFAAAVADYRPARVAAEKIKKAGDTLTLELVKNVDIAATLGQTKRAEQFRWVLRWRQRTNGPTPWTSCAARTSTSWCSTPCVTPAPASATTPTM